MITYLPTDKSVLAARAVPPHFGAVMKTVFGAVIVCLAVVMISGCISHPGPFYRAGDETPPDFLTGPAAIVLTNVDGYSAELTATMSSATGETRTVSGELLARDGRLIFQRSLRDKSKKQRKAGGLFFIWDENKNDGYILSEALQGYAPIKSSLAVTNVVGLGNEGVEEEANGHPCHRNETVVHLNDGTTGRLVVWRADDLRHFPVRIESVNGPKQVTLNLSEVRLEYPAQELFSPPDGFTAYASSVTMMNELIVRESSLSRKNDREFDETTPVTSQQNWHAGPSQ
jgi:hypothetical protein